jgi:hypothetical protein
MFQYNNFFPPEVVAFTTGCTIDFTFERSVPLKPEQSEYLRKRVGAAVPKIFNINQQHGVNIVTAKTLDIPKVQTPKADAVITNVPGIPLTVRTADCLPVFVYDPARKVIALIHAGWKGSQKTIAAHTIKKMNDLFKCQTTDLLVVFGPAIRSCCYQVGEEFRRYFPHSTEVRDKKYYMDLITENKNQLARMNVKESNMFDFKVCTCCDTKYFSYRREGDSAGRMLSLIMIK